MQNWIWCWIYRALPTDIGLLNFVSFLLTRLLVLMVLILSASKLKAAGLMRVQLWNCFTSWTAADFNKVWYQEWVSLFCCVLWRRVHLRPFWLYFIMITILQKRIYERCSDLPRGCLLRCARFLLIIFLTFHISANNKTISVVSISCSTSRSMAEKLYIWRAKNYGGFLDEKQRSHRQSVSMFIIMIWTTQANRLVDTALFWKRIPLVRSAGTFKSVAPPSATPIFHIISIRQCVV